MNSAKSKGDLSEREAREEYEKYGWSVYRPTRCSRFTDKDIFNMFDFVAVNGDQVHFVQVKTGRTQGFLKVLEQWKKDHPVPGVSWILMVRQNLREHKEKWKFY